MGETIDIGLTRWAYASARKAARWAFLLNIFSYVKKHKDTIRQFQIIQKVHVESLKEKLKKRET